MLFRSQLASPPQRDELRRREIHGPVTHPHTGVPVQAGGDLAEIADAATERRLRMRAEEWKGFFK